MSIESGFWKRLSEPVIVSGQQYKVVYVIDGDTFTVDAHGREATVRMLGIDTPETVDRRRQVGCFGPQASAASKELLFGHKVRLELNPDREARDKYGRTLAYVYREDGLFVNRYLIERGYAREYTYGTPYLFQTEFRLVQSSARDHHLGLWGVCKLQDHE